MIQAAKRSILTTMFAVFATMPADGLQIRSYSPSDHDRFTGFPESPAINGNSFYDGTRIRGIGWRADEIQWQFTLITRSHVLFATHVSLPIGSEIRFLNDTGQIVSRQVTSKNIVKNDDGDPATADSDSDLILVRLDAPINADEGVAPIAYLDLPSNRAYIGKELTVFGRDLRAGRGVISGFANITESNLNPTQVLRFEYEEDGDPVDGADDAKLENGDSGSPSLHKLASGQMCLVGIHSSIETDEDEGIQINHDGFVPEYVDQIDGLLESTGYRMTPANAATTTLAANETVITGNPRKGNPLAITFTLQNTGSKATGNLEVDFEFAPGEEPDSISGSDWIAYGGGSDWTVRRALLDRSSSTTLTLSWASAPLVENLTYNIEWRSDKATGSTLSPSYLLGSSFNEWASGLSAPGQTDDPDGDRLLNLSEYAFGSDAENGTNLLPNGTSAQLSPSTSGSLSILSFPEREDAASRGLRYLPEWSSDLTFASWTLTPPAGFTSSISTYDPDVPGFVRRTLSWPSDETSRFVRIRILLDE